MSSQNMLTMIDGPMLATAFPARYTHVAILAANEAVRLLAARQWTERFTVQIEAECVLIPYRLRFTSSQSGFSENDEAWRFVTALRTRSNDGFERQRAARDLLTASESWTAPFIVALIGEYIVEILEDISNAMTPELERTLGAFIQENSDFWATTKRRVASYWNVYYRSSWASELRQAYRRDEYIGFRLVNRLEGAAFGSAGMTHAPFKAGDIQSLPGNPLK